MLIVCIKASVSVSLFLWLPVNVIKVKGFSCIVLQGKDKIILKDCICFIQKIIWLKPAIQKIAITALKPASYVCKITLRLNSNTNKFDY